MSFDLVVTYKAKKGEEAVLQRHLEAMIAPTRSEPGCLSYRVIRCRDDDGLFVLVESYRTEADFETHRDTAHFEEHIRSGAWNLLDSRDAVFGEEIDG